MLVGMSSGIETHTPEPPYWAALFTSQRTDGDQGYGAMAERMVALAREQPGYLGVESVRDSTGLGITISYWTDEESIRRWKAVAAHRAAQELGKSRWYAEFALRVAKVERQSFGP